jgi:hypothetical protein
MRQRRRVWRKWGSLFGEFSRYFGNLFVVFPGSHLNFRSASPIGVMLIGIVQIFFTRNINLGSNKSLAWFLQTWARWPHCHPALVCRDCG